MLKFKKNLFLQVDCFNPTCNQKTCNFLMLLTDLINESYNAYISFTLWDCYTTSNTVQNLLCTIN